MAVGPRNCTSGKGMVLALMAAVSCLGGCNNDPNPRPMKEKRADGTPWLVRYAGMPDEPRSLDPQISYDQMSRRILEPIVETLLEYHPYKTDPYEVVPSLLDSMPARIVNGDGTVTYTCRLKKGIRFTDDPCFPGGKGRELVANDVQFTFQRLSDPKLESPVFSNLAEYIMGMTEAHAAAKQNGAVFDYSKPLPGIELVDSHTFKLHLRKAYPQILYWLAMHFTSPVAREAVEYYDGEAHPDGPGGKPVIRDKFAWHPVGTGPFRLKDYSPGHLIRLERNVHYTTSVFPEGGWPPEKEEVLRPLAGKPLPLVDEVIFTIFRETLPIWLLTRQGYLDTMGVSKDAYNSLITPSKELTPKFRDRGMRLEKDVEPSTFFLSINLEDPVLGLNKKLRQALSCALDSQGWIDIFYNSVPPVAQQLVPPGIFGYQPEFRNPYGFDLKKARQLIAEAGYPNGRDKEGKQLVLTMDVNASGAEERQSVEYNQRLLEQLGIKVIILENNFGGMLEKHDQGNFQMAYGTGWGADYPDPENFFFLFYSKNFPPAGKNVSRYKNVEFDRLFEQMATMENSPARFEIVKQLNAILVEDCPAILEFNKAYYVVVQPFAPRTHNNLMLEGGIKYSWIDYELRERNRREWNPRARWPVAVAVLGVFGALGFGLFLNRRRNV